MKPDERTAEMAFTDGGDTVFLTDHSIESESEDEFGHVTLVNRILSFLETCKTHLNIGLYGKWGVGKTGILNVLQEKLAKEPLKSRYDYLYIDTWKLSKESLRHQLLVELASKYDKDKTEEEIMDRLFHTREEFVKPKKETVRDKLVKLLRESTPYFIIFAGLVIVGSVLEYFFHLENLLPIVSFFIIIPLLLSLLKRLAEASEAVSKSAKRIIPRVESPFEFAKVFQELISKKGDKKLVIALDNLDRCDSELVVDILGTIKTFMESEGVVYIIACDDEALVKHLESNKGFGPKGARDFLRKFFQISISIPSFIGTDLENYADKLASKLNMHLSEGVKQVLIAGAIDNPRRIKQLLNNFVASYQLAKEREEKNLLRRGAVTKHTDFLAKMVVIQDEYPEFYEMLSKQDDLLDYVECYLSGEDLGDMTPDTIQNLFKDNPGVEWFMRATRTIQVENVSPFIKLGQESYESTVSELDELRLKVRQGDPVPVQRMLDKFKDDEKINSIWAIFRMLDEHMRKHRFLFAFNDLNVLLHIFDEIPTEMRKEMLRRYELHASSKEMLQHLSKLDQTKMFSILPEMSSRYRATILLAYSDLLIRDSALDTGLLDLLIGNRNILTRESKVRIDNALASFYSKNEVQAQKVLQDKIIPSKEIKESLFLSSTVGAIVSKIGGNEISDYEKRRADMYFQLRDVVSSSVKTNFVRKMLGIFPKQVPNTIAQNIQFALTYLTKLEGNDVSAEIVPELYSTLIRFSDAMENEQQKLSFFKPVLVHLNKLPKEEQQSFVEKYLSDRLISGQPDVVFGILNMVAESQFPLLKYEDIFNGLLERVKGNLSDTTLVNFLITQSSMEQKNKVGEILITNIRSGNERLYTPALSSFATHHSSLPSKVKDQIGLVGIEVARKVTPEKKPIFFDAITSAFSEYSSDVKNGIAQEVLELMRQSDPLRARGLQYYKKVRAEISKDSQRHVLRQLILNLSGILESPLRPMVDLILDGQEVLEEEDFTRLIDFLVGQISTAKPEEIQLTALNYVLTLSNLYKRGKEVLEVTLEVSKSGSERVKNLGKQVVQKFNRYEVPEDYWKRAKEVFGEDVGP